MLRIFAPGFLLGTFLFHELSGLPTVWWLLLWVPCAVMVLWRRTRATMFVSAFSIALIWTCAQSAWQLSQPLPEQFYGKDILVQGYIASLPESETHKQRFDFDVTEILQPGVDFRPRRLRLSWYHSEHIELHAGQEWILSVRIKPARNFANPGAFDYSAWLWQKGIGYTGYVSKHADTQLVSHAVTSYPLQQLRERIRAKLKQHLAHLHFEPVFRALLIGERSDVSPDQWNVLQKTGTIHLMAISGLHVGLVAGFVFLLSRFVWSRITGLSLRLAAPRAASILAFLSAIIYAALAGFSLPTQRAVIMLGVIMGAVFLQRKTNSFDVLSLALILVLIHDAHAVLSVSFWLSFVAVALIFYMLQFRQRQTGTMHHWLYLQAGISFGLLPFTVYFFQQAPLISPLANLLAIPLVTFVIIPLIMIALVLLFIHPPAAIALFSGAQWVLEYLWMALDGFMKIPFASVTYSTPPAMMFLFVIAGVLVALLPSSIRFRYLAFVLVIPLIFQSHWRPPAGEARLSLLDVGQGLAAVIETKHHLLVFDTGARFSEQFDLGGSVIAPYLIQQGHVSIDKLIISHGDNDHIGGAQTLLSRFPVHQLLTSVPDKLSEHEPTRCVAGMQWRWDDVHIQVLYPDRKDYGIELSENDLSCVLQIRTRSKTFLLTGDIEAEAEARLVARYGEALRSHVLLVPHHGSKTSSTTAFIQQVKPEIALLATGWRNRYHFPHPVVTQRYQLAGSKMYTTAEHGALIYDTQTGRLTPWRAQTQRFWQSRDVD